MNDNSAYIVQCNQDNFDDVRYLLQMFCQVIHVDSRNYCIRIFALDGTLKRRLDDIGASFWEEPDYAATKSVMGRGL